MSVNTALPRNPVAFTWWATRGHRTLMAVCWSAVVCGIIASRFEFYFISQLIDFATEFSKGNDTLSSIWTTTLLLVGLYLLGELLWRTSGFTAQKWMTSTYAQVYDGLFKYLTGHSASYFQDRFAGAITNKITNAAQGVLGLLQITTWQFIGLILGLVADSYLLYSVHYSLALTLAIWFIIFFGADLILVVRLRKFAYKHALAASSLKGKLVDSATNIDSVHQQAEEPYEQKYLSKYINREKKAHRKSWFMFEWILVVNGVLLGGFILLMLYSSITMFIHDQITIGAVVLVITILYNLERNLFFLGEQMSRSMQLYGQISEGLEELLEPHEITAPKKADALKLRRGMIELKNVDFTYGDQPLFSDLNLEIHGGQKVGLVGASGAGKSTLVNLLLRQYDVTGGQIEIDGQDIRSVNLSSLRKMIALVPQSTTLFHRSIAENIRYGRLEASEEDVIQASRMAQAHDFIMELTENYETFVGERGVKLSGGQRQRISIARAILKDAPILILDEATSALDSESETAIQNALELLMQGRTVIAIAHRLSTLTQMDRILVMQDGKIVEDGSHDELVAKKGLYQKLWARQVGGFLDDRIIE